MFFKDLPDVKRVQIFCHVIFLGNKNHEKKKSTVDATKQEIG
jgi:hypothetical protein